MHGRDTDKGTDAATPRTLLLFFSEPGWGVDGREEVESVRTGGAGVQVLMSW
jgi:hypothetical protein